MIPGETEPAGLRACLVDHFICCGVHWYNLHLLFKTILSTEMIKLVIIGDTFIWSETSHYVGVQLSAGGAGWSLCDSIINTAYFKLTLSTVSTYQILFNSNSFYLNVWGNLVLQTWALNASVLYERRKIEYLTLKRLKHLWLCTTLYIT